MECDPVKVVLLAGGQARVGEVVAVTGRRRLEQAISEGRLVRSSVIRYGRSRRDHTPPFGGRGPVRREAPAGQRAIAAGRALACSGHHFIVHFGA